MTAPMAIVCAYKTYHATTTCDGYELSRVDDVSATLSCVCSRRLNTLDTRLTYSVCGNRKTTSMAGTAGSPGFNSSAGLKTPTQQYPG